MGHEALKRKMDESFEWDIRYYSECVENLLTKQEQVTRIIDSLNGELDSLDNFWHHVTCGTSFLTIRMETVKEARRIVNATKGDIPYGRNQGRKVNYRCP